MKLYHTKVNINRHRLLSCREKIKQNTVNFISKAYFLFGNYVIGCNQSRIVSVLDE